MIEHRDVGDLMVAAEMIQMRVRVDDRDRQGCQSFDNAAQVSNAAAGVDEDRTAAPEQQINDGVLEVTRL